MKQSDPGSTFFSDEYWMRGALEKAQEAQKHEEVPVGAVVVYKNQVIGAAGNSPIHLSDPTAHAEILALRQAASFMKNYRLPQATLYVTLEPCVMCMGAIVQARIKKLVFGADDPKTGAAQSVYKIGQDGLLNHNLEITRGILAPECSRLLKDFFAQRRKNNKNIMPEK